MSNPLRKLFTGPDADLHLGTARSLLGALKSSMSLGDLPAGRIKRTIEGVDYDVMSLFGMDQVRINVPEPADAPRRKPLTSELAPVAYELEVPGQEFDTIGVLYIDVFWFVSTMEANPDPYYTFEEDMWFRMRNTIVEAFEEAIAPLDFEDGHMTVTPRFTVISDRKHPEDVFNIDGIYTVYPREQKTYAMGMNIDQFRALSKPHASAGGFGTGEWSTIDMGNWYSEAPGQKLGDVQYVGVILSEIAEQLMWMDLDPPDQPPEILIVQEGMMTLPIFPVILIDAGRGYGESSQNFATHYDDNGRVVQAFTKNQVMSAWYTSWAQSEHSDSLSDRDRLPFDIESQFPELKPGFPMARFFPSVISSFGDGAVSVTPDHLEAAVFRASQWLAEAATNNEGLLAERGYKDRFDMVHTVPLVDWNHDEKRAFEAIPPIPFEE